MGSEVGADWVLVDVGAATFEFFSGLDLVVGVSSLPDVELRGQAMGETSSDMFHGVREVVGCEE